MSGSASFTFLGILKTGRRPSGGRPAGLTASRPRMRGNPIKEETLLPTATVRGRARTPQPAAKWRPAGMPPAYCRPSLCWWTAPAEWRRPSGRRTRPEDTSRPGQRGRPGSMTSRAYAFRGGKVQSVRVLSLCPPYVLRVLCVVSKGDPGRPALASFFLTTFHRGHPRA